MATHPLFRQEALDHATGRLDGQVLLAAPLATWCALAIIIAVLGLATWFAATASYTRKESARGWLVPEGGLARVFAGGEGFVTALMVAEGDHVEAGQPLARIGDPGQDTQYRAPPRSPSRAGLVHAPLDGRVEAVRVQLGQYVPHGATVAVLAAGDGLVAEISPAFARPRARRGRPAPSFEVRRPASRRPRHPGRRRHSRLECPPSCRNRSAMAASPSRSPSFRFGSAFLPSG